MQKNRLPGMAFLFILLAIYSPLQGHSANTALPVRIPEGPWQEWKISAFIKLNPSDFSRLSGRRMNPVQRFAFGMVKQKMKKELKRNQDMTVREFLSEPRKLTKWWQIAILVVLAVLMIIVFVNVSKLG